MTRPIAIIAGIGEGLGLALVGELTRAGFDVIGLARSQRVVGAARLAAEEAGAAYWHATCDLTSSPAVSDAIANAAKELPGEIEVLVYAAHSLLIEFVTEISSATFEATWRTGCLGAFHATTAVLPPMIQRGRGTLIFIGATASVRGGARFAAFASAKFALRGLAQSLARELGPQGIHVAHAIIDGLIDAPQTTERFGTSSGVRIEPEAIAASCLMLVRQPPSAWTHEIDLRPSSERF